jgi:hypothetical protein
VGEQRSDKDNQDQGSECQLRKKGRRVGTGHDARDSSRRAADEPNMSNSTDSRQPPCEEAGDDPLGVLASELGSAPAETNWCAKDDDDCCEARRPLPPPPPPAL